jgi:ferric-dicitrate binding protein FerR (iron transport regulator)
MNNSKEQRARRIASLLAGYIRDTLTPAEHDELDEWVGASDKNMRLFEELTDEKRIQLALELLNDNKETGILKELQEEETVPAQRSVGRRVYRKLAVAASIVFLVGAAVFFVVWSSNKNKSNLVKNTPASTPIAKQDIKPGGYKAYLQKKDGSIVDLENTKGLLGNQGGSEITNQDGELKYSPSTGEISDSSTRNLVTTPRGGKYLVTLSDGTKAWMNTFSSISYPPTFTGNKRVVEITGEVYFEVASAKDFGPNYQKPFIVKVKDRNMAVQVLGTHFNINAYNDEPVIKTTLLEGLVKVDAGTRTSTLKPGQQAQVSYAGDIKLKEVDASLFTGWKDGILQPKASDLGSVLREIGRWYNVDIIFENNNTISSRSYSGTININSNLSKTLQTLNASPSLEDVTFSIEGRTIIVRPS